MGGEILSSSRLNEQLGLYVQLVNLLHQKESAKLQDRDGLKGKIKTIADLLLVQPRLDQQFDAAFAYYAAGYYARAFTLISPLAITLTDVPAAERWLALFLAKEFKTLDTEIQEVLDDESYSDESIQSGIQSGALTKQTKQGKTIESEIVDRILSRSVASCFYDFLIYVKTGNDSQLAGVYDRLKQCERLAVKAREPQWWWWLAYVRFVIREFTENSLWSCLKPMITESEIVTQFIQANYRRDKPMVELWRSQTESLDSVNDPERRSYCLKMPTGAGKTRVAELMILRFLIDHQNSPDLKCVYIAPFRTLASEVEDTLCNSFDSIQNAVVSEFYGGYEIDPFDQIDVDQARILVMTPEKLDGMLRQKTELLGQIRLVIVDEGHLIGEAAGDGLTGDRGRDRGRRFQMLLQRLVYILKIKRNKDERDGTRLLFISGVLPNVGDFADWLTGDRKNVVESSWRPTEEPQYWDLIWDGKNLVRSDTNEPILLPPVDLDSQLRILDDDCNASQRQFAQVVGQAAVAFAKSTGTLLFSASKNRIKSKRLLATIETILQREGLFEHAPLPSQFHEILSSETRLLERGVAVHHGDLPTALRREMEKRIYDRRVRLALASPTLAQGVNLPFHTVLVYGLEHKPGDRISDTMFWNVVGRVGRPLSIIMGSQKVSPPEIWFLLDRSLPYQTEDEKHRDELLKRRDSFRISTAFLEFLRRIKQLWQEKRGNESIVSLVLYLAENDLSWIDDDQQRREIESLLDLIDSHLNDLSREARLSPKPVEDCLQEITEELIRVLQGVEVLSDADLKYVKEAVRARAVYLSQRIPERQRERDYLLGLPEKDRSAIKAHQDELLEWYKATESIFTGEQEEGIEHLAKIMVFVSGLSIVDGKAKQDDVSLASTIPTLFDLSAVPRSDSRLGMFRAWIRGDEEMEVARYLHNADLGDYREYVLERSLPWGMSAIGRFLSNLAQERNFVLPRSLDYLPSLIKYGVPHPIACRFVRMGFSRSAAKKILELYTGSGQSKDIIGLDGITLDDMIWTHDTALLLLQNLAEDDVTHLKLARADKERIAEIRRRGS